MRVSGEYRCGVARCLTALALALLTPAASRAEVVYSEQVETYDVGSRNGTPNELWRNIGRFGPKVDGADAIGMAAGRVRWRAEKVVPTQRGCVLRDVRVDVSVKITLPEWSLSHTGTRASQAFWGCVVRTVTTHENRHAEIWRETGDRIDRALQDLGAMPCNDVKSRIDQVAGALYREGRERQAEFDAADKRRRRYEQCFAQRPGPSAEQAPEREPVRAAPARAAASAVGGTGAGPRQPVAAPPAPASSSTGLEDLGLLLLKVMLFSAVLAGLYLAAMRWALQSAARSEPVEADGVPQSPNVLAPRTRGALAASGAVRDVTRAPAQFGQPRASFGLRKA